MLREIASTEIYTVLLVVCLLLVATTKLLFSRRFQDFIGLLINYKYLKLYNRRHKFFDIFEGLLFTNLTIGLAIFVIISYNMSPSLDLSQHFSLYAAILSIAILFILKTLIERLIASTLKIDTFISKYLFLKTSYKNFLGLLLIPINTLLLFTFDLSQWIIGIFITLLMLINWTGIFFFTKHNVMLIKNNTLYFILYICALEISPYFILYKLITK